MVEEDKLDNNEYRSMAKGTAMMGWVQVSNILINKRKTSRSIPWTTRNGSFIFASVIRKYDSAGL